MKIKNKKSKESSYIKDAKQKVKNTDTQNDKNNKQCLQDQVINNSLFNENNLSNGHIDDSVQYDVREAIRETNNRFSPDEAYHLDEVGRKLIEEVFNLINPILSKGGEFIVPDFFEKLPEEPQMECKLAHYLCWQDFLFAYRLIRNVYDNIKEAEYNVTDDDIKEILMFADRLHKMTVLYKEKWQKLRQQYPEITQDDDLIKDLSQVSKQCYNLYKRKPIELQKSMDREFVRQACAEHPLLDIQRAYEFYNVENYSFARENNPFYNEHATNFDKNYKQRFAKKKATNKKTLKKKSIVPVKKNEQSNIKQMLNKVKMNIVNANKVNIQRNAKKKEDAIKQLLKLQINKPLKKRKKFVAPVSKNQYKCTKLILNRVENDSEYDSKYEAFCKNNFR